MQHINYLKKVATIIYKYSYLATCIALFLRLANSFELLSTTAQNCTYFTGGNIVGKTLTLFACVGAIRLFQIFGTIEEEY
jgi:hypothetical protein